MTETNFKQINVEAALKGIVHLKIKIMSPLPHPQVIPNLHDLLSSVEHERST